MYSNSIYNLIDIHKDPGLGVILRQRLSEVESSTNREPAVSTVRTYVSIVLFVQNLMIVLLYIRKFNY